MAGSFLAGVRVLDLSIWRPGPYATSLLCALGADVVKVEPPGGDPMRHYRGLFEEINAGKRSVVLDLKTPPGRDRAETLASEADILVEGFRPGVMARLGLDEPRLRPLNPGLVYCSISGYGQYGTGRRSQATTSTTRRGPGALAPEGGAATMPPLPVADLAAGMSAAFGVCAALAGRTATGQGARLDISMTDVLSTWTGQRWTQSGRKRADHRAGLRALLDRDGNQLSLGVVDEQHFWTALCTVLGRDDLAGLDFAARTADGEALQGALAVAVAARPRQELIDDLLAAGVPAAPVLDRAAMLDAAEFPDFPIRLDTAARRGRVPFLDENQGEGFHPRP